MDDVLCGHQLSVHEGLNGHFKTGVIRSEVPADAGRWKKSGGSRKRSLSADILRLFWVTLIVSPDVLGWVKRASCLLGLSETGSR